MPQVEFKTDPHRRVKIDAKHEGSLGYTCMIENHGDNLMFVVLDPERNVVHRRDIKLDEIEQAIKDFF